MAKRHKKKQGANQPSRPNIEPAPEIQQHPLEVDNSSAKPLTTEFLKELNRQIFRPSLPLLSPSDTSRVAHFAELGGPDLSDLRGYQLPRNFLAMATDMRSFIPPTNAVLAPKPPPLGDLLIKCKINPTLRSQKPDIRSLQDTLTARRPSVSLSTVSDDAYEKFLETVSGARSGSELSYYLIPTLMGNEYSRELVARGAPFLAMGPFGQNIPAAQPDLYCGEYPHENLDKSVREALAKHITTSDSERMPIVPNFFLEYEDPNFAEKDIKSRAQHDGAIGSRAIHSLQNYGNEEPQYDNQPYTFSATFYEGILMLYAHHVTGPREEGELPEFHMNLIGHFHILGSRESLIEGITAFRNARDEAKKHRDRFIAAANRKRASLQELADTQVQQLRNALQSHNISGDAARQLIELVQQAYLQPAAVSAAPMYQAAQLFQSMLQQPAVASAAPFHQTTQVSQGMLQQPAAVSAAPLYQTAQPFQATLQQPAAASAAPFHPTTQAFHTIPQPPAAIRSEPLHPGPEDGQHSSKGAVPMTRAPPSATSTPQRAAPSKTATRHKRPAPSQDAPSQPSVKRTRTGRKY